MWAERALVVCTRCFMLCAELSAVFAWIIFAYESSEALWLSLFVVVSHRHAIVSRVCYCLLFRHSLVELATLCVRTKRWKWWTMRLNIAVIVERIRQIRLKMVCNVQTNWNSCNWGSSMRKTAKEQRKNIRKVNEESWANIINSCWSMHTCQQLLELWSHVFTPAFLPRRRAIEFTAFRIFSFNFFSVVFVEIVGMVLLAMRSWWLRSLIFSLLNTWLLAKQRQAYAKRKRNKKRWKTREKISCSHRSNNDACLFSTQFLFLFNFFIFVFLRIVECSTFLLLFSYAPKMIVLYFDGKKKWERETIRIPLNENIFVFATANSSQLFGVQVENEKNEKRRKNIFQLHERSSAHILSVTARKATINQIKFRNQKYVVNISLTLPLSLALEFYFIFFCLKNLFRDPTTATYKKLASDKRWNKWMIVECALVVVLSPATKRDKAFRDATHDDNNQCWRICNRNSELCQERLCSTNGTRNKKSTDESVRFFGFFCLFFFLLSAPIYVLCNMPFSSHIWFLFHFSDFNSRKIRNSRPCRKTHKKKTEKCKIKVNSKKRNKSHQMMYKLRKQNKVIDILFAMFFLVFSSSHRLVNATTVPW